MASAITTQQYSVRPYRAEDEPEVLALMEASLGAGPSGRRDPDLWRWKHINNPFGRSFTNLACDSEGRVVGMRAFMQWQFRAAGSTLRAVRAVDTATHPDHQRKGIFSRLSLHTLEQVGQDGVHLVFNTPNQYSMPGYLKMGWSYVGILQPAIKVLNPVRFAVGLVQTRLRGPIRSYEHGDFFKSAPPSAAALLSEPSAVEALLEHHRRDVSDPSRLETHRTVEYLRWRYTRHPHLRYYAVASGSGSRLDGMAIFRPNTRFGLREVVLCELLLRQPDRRLCQRLVQQIHSYVRADYLIAHFHKGSFQMQALGRCGFIPVPRMGMKFTSRPLAEDLPSDPLRLESWALSLGDLELF